MATQWPNFHESTAGTPGTEPSLVTIEKYLTDKYPHVFQSFKRATIVGQGSDPSTVNMAFLGQCDGGDTANYPFVYSFQTSVYEDSYQLSVLGGPGEPDIGPDNVFPYALSRGNYTNAFFRTNTARMLPWISKLYAFDGIVHDLTTLLPPQYGTFDIPDPKNPGTMIPAPGQPDRTVQGFGLWIWRQASATLPAAGTGAQTTETMAGYTSPVYNTSALDIDATTKALYVKWNPDDLKLDDQGRLDLSDSVKSGLGGGGSGGTSYGSMSSDAAITMPDTTWVFVPLPNIDPNQIGVSAGTGPTAGKMVLDKKGLWFVAATVWIPFASAQSGDFGARIWVNGGPNSPASSQFQSNTSNWIVSFSSFYEGDIGDTLEIDIYQSTGATLTTNTAAYGGAQGYHLFAKYLGDAAASAGSNSGMTPETADYTILPGDNGKIIRADAASLTFTLPDPTTLTPGFTVTIKNNGETTTGVKTNAAGVLIDGVDCSSTPFTAGLTVPYGTVILTTDLTDWFTL